MPANQPASQPTNQPANQPTSQPANQPTSQPPPPPATSHQHQGGGSVSYRANGVKTIFTARKFFACSTKSMVFRRYWLKKRLQKSCCGAVWALEIRSKLTCFFLAFSNSPFIFPRGARRLFAYFFPLFQIPPSFFPRRASRWKAGAAKTS